MPKEIKEFYFTNKSWIYRELNSSPTAWSCWISASLPLRLSKLVSIPTQARINPQHCTTISWFFVFILETNTTRISSKLFFLTSTSEQCQTRWLHWIVQSQIISLAFHIAPSKTHCGRVLRPATTTGRSNGPTPNTHSWLLNFAISSWNRLPAPPFPRKPWQEFDVRPSHIASTWLVMVVLLQMVWSGLQQQHHLTLTPAVVSSRMSAAASAGLTHPTRSSFFFSSPFASMENGFALHNDVPFCAQTCNHKRRSTRTSGRRKWRLRPAGMVAFYQLFKRALWGICWRK